MERSSMRMENDPEQIIRTYSHMVYCLAFARTGIKEDAEEVCQEVFLRLLKKRPAFESAEHCKAWLLRVTANCSNTLPASLDDFWKRILDKAQKCDIVLNANELHLHLLLCKLLRNSSLRWNGDKLCWTLLWTLCWIP